jgi:hypothetical protein
VILTQLQQLIGDIYDVRIAHDVYDFLVTDRRRLPVEVRGRSSEEDFIIAQPAAAGDAAAVSLYLDPGLLERLQRENPLVRLHDGNVADYCKALEGVSHFLYLAWHAGYDRPVSILELEMQAEVDKYVASYWLLRRQLPGRFPAELRRILFERTRIDARLADGREDLYREASRYAEKFCRRLEQSLRRRGAGTEGEVLTELRRFYRLSNARKLAHIERG